MRLRGGMVYIVNTSSSIFHSEALGERADIHTGGMDLKFPHHDNEIAQAEVTNGQIQYNFHIRSIKGKPVYVGVIAHLIHCLPCMIIESGMVANYMLCKPKMHHTEPHLCS